MPPITIRARIIYRKAQIASKAMMSRSPAQDTSEVEELPNSLEEELDLEIGLQNFTSFAPYIDLTCAIASSRQGPGVSISTF